MSMSLALGLGFTHYDGLQGHLRLDGSGANWLGDSIASQSYDSQTSVGSIGLAAGAVRQAGDQFQIVNNYSVGGSVSADLAAQATAAIAGSLTTTFIHTGSNDASISTASATYLANIKAACTSLKADGHRVILCVPIQRQDAAWTPTMQGFLESYWTALIAEPLGVFWDYIVRTDQVKEWSADGITVNANMKIGPASEAGVHPPAEGAYYLMKKIKQSILVNQPSYTTLNTESLTGAAGAKDGTMSGSLATGFIGIGTALGTVTAVFSKPTDSEQAITFAGAAGTDELALIFGNFSAYTAGTVIRLKIKVKADSLIEGVAAFAIGIANDAGTPRATANSVVTNLYKNGSPWPNLGADVGGGYVTYWSPPYTVAGGGENLGLYIALNTENSQTVAGTITYTEPEIVELV